MYYHQRTDNFSLFTRGVTLAGAGGAVVAAGAAVLCFGRLISTAVGGNDLLGLGAATVTSSPSCFVLVLFCWDI